MLAALLLFLLFPCMLLACREPPGPGPTRNVLHAVVALSASDAWAIGGMSTSAHFGSKVLIEHWNGRHWQTAMPDMDGELCSISADSATDVWAVGAGRGYCESDEPLLVLHWDGQRWQQVSAGLNPGTGVLNSVLALSPRNVWVVGAIGGQALIEHWDGSSWNAFAVPQPFNSLASSLKAIAGRAANDLWVIGSATDATGNAGPLSEHWDGRSWTVVPMPGIMQDKRLLGISDFPGLAAVPGGQVWAAGQINLPSLYPPTPLIERWNGKQWQVAYDSAPPHPSLQEPAAAFVAIIALDAQNAWAVGYRADNGAPGAGSTAHVLVYHWDGQSWQPVKAPTFKVSSGLSDISAQSADDIWAVGTTSPRPTSGDSVTLIEHWDGTSWQAVSSPNPGTPAPPLGVG